jgi:adenine-specific DNA-methyltransferase
MSIEQLNKYLQSLTTNSLDTSVTLSQSLLQLLGIIPLAQKETIVSTSATLQNMLVENPIVKGQQLFFQLSKADQPINCRLAVVKKINKQTIYRLIYENKFYSWQANIGNVGTDNLPYTIDFITNKNYQQLTVVLTQGEQIRTLNFNNRLTNLQVNKILPKWLNIAQQPKAIINADLWGSLDIKEVNKQFYITIKDRFDTLISNIQEQHPITQPNQQKMFAIKLIGRYLFCWFLKEKEIIPAQALSSASLSKYTNIYNQIINPLFFITLNTLPQPEREYPNYVPNEFVKLFASVPYLNGGLFEESDEDKLISSLQIDAWLLQFIRFLEEYNFTVDESSPNYEQLAIDPEMLGRILENLLASLNTETEKMANERKSLGAFYTPRVIVDYMVTESLKYYLIGKLLPNTNDNADTTIEEDFFTITSNKVPSLFSAQEPQQLALDIDKLTKEDSDKEAYIKAKINKLFNVWDDTNPFTKTETQIVRDALQQCKIIDPACGSGAFPMGILHKLEMLNEKLGTDKSAYKLRRYILSQNIYGVDILPIAVEISRLRAWLSLILVSDFKPTDKKHNFGIEALPNLDFKFVCANALISNGYDDFITLAKQSQIPTLIRLNTEIEYLEDIRNEYFNSSNTDNKKKKLIQNFEAKKEYIKQNFRLQKDKLNINDFLAKIDDWNPFNDNKASSFFSPAWMLGVTDGFDIVIGNPPYVPGKALNEETKKYFKTNYKLLAGKYDLYISFIERGLKLNLFSKNLIFIIPNTFLANVNTKILRKYLFDNKLLKSVTIYDELIFENQYVESAVIFVNNIQSSYSFAILDKSFEPIKNISYLEVLADSEYRIQVNKNLKDDSILTKIFIDAKPFGKITETCIGIQIGGSGGNNEIKKDFISDQKINEMYKKVIDGKDFEPFIIKAKEKYIKYGDWLHRKRDEKFFLNPKIITRQIGETPISTLDFNNYYSLNTVYNSIVVDNNFNITYLYSIVRSSLVKYVWSKKFSDGKTLFPKIKKSQLSEIPIISIPLKRQQLYINLVNKILTAKQQNARANTSLLEREIDIRVYHLYKLTLPEAQLIDATLTEDEFSKYKN